MLYGVIMADGVDLTLIGAETLIDGYASFRLLSVAHSYDDLNLTLETVAPDIVVIGEQLDVDLDVLTLVARLSERVPRLVMVGGIMDGALIHELLVAGLQSYLFNGDEMRFCLFRALNAVVEDRLYLSPTANAEYLVAMQSSHTLDSLDEEARQVLTLLARGEHAGQISERLGIDKRRVYWVREKLRRRFGAKTNEHLISRATAEGFLYPRD